MTQTKEGFASFKYAGGVYANITLQISGDK